MVKQRAKNQGQLPPPPGWSWRNDDNIFDPPKPNQIPFLNDSIHYDECNIIIEIEPTDFLPEPETDIDRGAYLDLVNVRKPKWQFIYRNPNCVDPQPPRPPNGESPLPPAVQAAIDYPECISSITLYYFGGRKMTTLPGGRIVGEDYEYDRFIPSGDNERIGITGGQGELQVDGTYYYDGGFPIPGNDAGWGRTDDCTGSIDDDVICGLKMTNTVAYYQEINDDVEIIMYEESYEFSPDSFSRISSLNSTLKGGLVWGVPMDLIAYEIVSSCSINQPRGFDPPPPPLPPKKLPPCCMCCQNDNNDRLLRLILQRIGTPTGVFIYDENASKTGAQNAERKPQTLFAASKLATERIELNSRITGIAAFPVEVPDTVLQPYKEGIFAKVFDFIDGEKKRKLKSVAEFIAWQAEQDSATTGQFHQVIEIDTKEGTQTIVIPCIADALREVLLLLTQIARNSSIDLDANVRTLIETADIKTLVAKALVTVQDIQDYLDYPTKEITSNVPVAVNIPSPDKEGQWTEQSESYESLMRNSYEQIIHHDWTGESSHQDMLNDILHVMSMLKAIIYQRTDVDG